MHIYFTIRCMIQASEDSSQSFDLNIILSRKICGYDKMTGLMVQDGKI